MSVINNDDIAELASVFLNAKSEADLNEKWLTVSDGKELWAAINKRIPALENDARRRWFAKRNKGDSLGRRDRLPESKDPCLKEDMIRVYRSHDSMIEAEVIASEFVASLKPWGARDADRIVWYFVETPFTHVAYLGKAFDFARDALWESLENRGLESVNTGIDSARFAVTRHDIPRLVVKTLQANAGWKYAVENDVSITGPNYAMTRGDWCRFVELTNPFSLLIEIWRKACFVFDIPNDEDPALKLYVRR